MVELKSILDRNPNFLPARIYLALTYAELGLEGGDPGRGSRVHKNESPYDLGCVEAEAPL